jgi:Protein of unknown function (DUF4238)
VSSEPIVSCLVVPEFLLRRFADPADRLMAERRDRSRRLALSVAQAAEEAGVYAAPAAVGRLAGEVEARAERVVSAMVAGAFPPQADDRAYLAVFLALQLVVARSHRAAAVQSAGILDGIIGASLEELLAGEADTGEEDPAPSAPEGTPAWSLSPVPSLARLLAARTWQLVRFPGRQLLTSDAPVVLWSRPGSLKPYQHGLAASAEARFPLDPGHALVVARTAPAGEVIRPLEARHARALNRTVAESAHTWMYYHPESDPMEGVELARPDDSD